MIDPPEVDVIVQTGVSEAQAERLWCDVVAPAGGSQFEGDLGALIYDDAGKLARLNRDLPVAWAFVGPRQLHQQLSFRVGCALSRRET
jgi:hypothetical protein